MRCFAFTNECTTTKAIILTATGGSNNQLPVTPLPVLCSSNQMFPNVRNLLKGRNPKNYTLGITKQTAFPCLCLYNVVNIHLTWFNYVFKVQNLYLKLYQRWLI
jgi:hypothetical protein